MYLVNRSLEKKGKGQNNQLLKLINYYHYRFGIIFFVDFIAEHQVPALLTDRVPHICFTSILVHLN